GDGTFAAPQNFATGTKPIAVAVGDFNGDGVLDLAVANNGSGNVSVLLGQGGGTFQAAKNFAAGCGAYAAAAGDFNQDGQLDLVVANHDSNNASVLLGNGDGTLQAKVNYATGSLPRAIAVGDFNGDGFPDFAVANQQTDNTSVLINAADWATAPAIGVDGGLRSVGLSTGGTADALPAAMSPSRTVAPVEDSTPMVQGTAVTENPASAFTLANTHQVAALDS